MCALDTKTGKDVWRDDRESRTSWSSPVIWKNEKRTELVTCGSGTVTSYDLSTGDVLWKMTGAGGAFSASPTFDQQRIYLGQSGRNSRGPLVAVNAGATGELTFDDIGENAVAWAAESISPRYVFASSFGWTSYLSQSRDSEFSSRLDWRTAIPRTLEGRVQCDSIIVGFGRQGVHTQRIRPDGRDRIR